MEENYEKYCVPIIGSVSCGKSTFLNSLIYFDDIDDNLLEEGLQTTTKFICVIRHNPKLECPELYHVTLEKDKNKIYYKESGERIKGRTKIKDEIKKINVNSKNEEDNNISNLFYILEINIKFSKYTKFFEEYDLLDIPGLDEANTSYAEKIVDCLKGNVKFCIYMFNDNYYKDISIMEIIKYINEKCNLTLNNSLIILNMKDGQSNKDNIMREFSGYLMKNLGDIIYDDSNTILVLNLISFKTENLAESNINNLLNYYKNTLEDNEDNNALLSKIKEVLNEVFNSQKKNEFKDFNQFIKSKSEKLNEDEDKKLMNNIETLGFDIENNENDEIDYFKSLYSCFKEKLININLSKEKESIINYFSKSKNAEYNNNEENYFEDKNKKERINLMIRMIKFFNYQLKELFPNDNDVNEFADKAHKLINSFFIEEKLRIPVVGCYNAGKSSIINSFIGEDLLPVESKENTKEIIFIRYKNIQNPRLIKSNLKKENYGYIRYYLEIDKNFNPIHGREKIRLFLQSKNDNKEDINKYNSNDSFYILETKIDLLDKLELSEDIKEMIEFIDIPGLNTSKNIFEGEEGESLSKIISVSNLFLFISPIDKSIKDVSNQNILNYLFRSIESRISFDKDFINSCIFIINKSDIDKNDSIKLEDIKKEISQLLNKDPKLINAQKFSSKEYINFLKSYEYYKHFELYVEKYKNKFNKTIIINRNFELYVYNEVKQKLKKDFKLKNVDNLENYIDISKRKDYLSISKACNNAINNKTNEIKMMINYGKNNFKKLPHYEKSKIDILIPFLKEKILNSRKYLYEIYSRMFSPFLKNELMIFFERDQNKKISDKEVKKINDNKKYLITKLNKMLKDNICISLLQGVNKDILTLFKKYKKEAPQLIKDNENIEEIINQLNRKIEEKLKDFILKFEIENEKISKEINTIINELRVQINESMNNGKIKIDNIQKLTHKFFDNINKGLLFGFSATGMITTGIIFDLTASITLGIVPGGIVGIVIGAAIGGIIIGIRSLFNEINKKKNYLELIENAQTQYISIFSGVEFKVKTRMEEIKNILTNLINFTTNFLNKQISSIQKDKWDKSKKEFYYISNKFEILFCNDLKN